MSRFKEICFVGNKSPSICDILYRAMPSKQKKFDIYNFCDGFVLGISSYNHFNPVRVTGSHFMDQPRIGGGDLDYFPHSEVTAGLMQRVEA